MKAEFFQNMRVGDQPLPKEVVDAILAENRKEVEAERARFADYDALKAQLAEAGKTIEGFKALDIEGVKKAAEEWKQKAEDARREGEEKLAALEFEGALKDAINAAGGRSAKAIRALLDVDALRQSRNRETDIKAALEGLKKESGYLFREEETPPPYAAGTGRAPVGGSKYSPEMAAIRAAAGLK